VAKHRGEKSRSFAGKKFFVTAFPLFHANIPWMAIFYFKQIQHLCCFYSCASGLFLFLGRGRFFFRCYWFLMNLSAQCETKSRECGKTRKLAMANFQYEHTLRRSRFQSLTHRIVQKYVSQQRLHQIHWDLRSLGTRTKGKTVFEGTLHKFILNRCPSWVQFVNMFRSSLQTLHY